MILYLTGIELSDCSSPNILRAVPMGTLVPASQAYTVFNETPISIANVFCVILRVYRKVVIWSDYDCVNFFMPCSSRLFFKTEDGKEDSTSVSYRLIVKPENFYT